MFNLSNFLGSLQCGRQPLQGQSCRVRHCEGVAEPRSEQAMKIGYLEDNFENSDFDQNLRFSEG